MGHTNFDYDKLISRLKQFNNEENKEEIYECLIDLEKDFYLDLQSASEDCDKVEECFGDTEDNIRTLRGLIDRVFSDMVLDLIEDLELCQMHGIGG